MDKKFPSVHTQSTLCAPVRKDGKWFCDALPFSPTDVSKTTVQIHHTGADHWVVSAKEPNQDEIFVIDSAKTSKSLTESLKIQLAQFNGRDRNQLEIHLPTIDRQKNSVDFGVHAIAWAVEICHLGISAIDSTKFDQSKMRVHLADCLETGELLPFPKLPKEIKLKLVKGTVQSSISGVNVTCQKSTTTWWRVMADFVWCAKVGTTGAAQESVPPSSCRPNGFATDAANNFNLI